LQLIYAMSTNSVRIPSVIVSKSRDMSTHLKECHFARFEKKCPPEFSPLTPPSTRSCSTR
jgi:hypothetical protein